MKKWLIRCLTVLAMVCLIPGIVLNVKAADSIYTYCFIRINRITISAGASGLLLSFCSAAVSCIMPQKAPFLKTFCHKLQDFT